MALSWNEIKDRAIRFSKEWETEISEKAEEGSGRRSPESAGCPRKIPQSPLTNSPTSLADLYDPLTMPPDLVKAHQELDKAVDLCYRPQPFPNETKRIAFLFELYDKYTADLFSREKPKKTRKT